MDYGYQLLKHVIAQVFGNLPQAARITLPLILVPTLILIATNTPLLVGTLQPIQLDASPQAIPPINAIGLVVGLIAAVIGWLWAAVAWHRFVLLEEYPTGPLPSWRGSEVGNYFGNSLLVFLVIFGAAICLGILIGIVTVVLQSAAVAVALGIGLAFGLSWVATRVGLILPAAAIGEKLGVGESWKATASVSGQLILPIFVIALGSTILNQAIIVLAGPTLFAFVLTMVVAWIQLLLNLAMMTTLYGNLIEGRQLN